MHDDGKEQGFYEWRWIDGVKKEVWRVKEVRPYVAPEGLTGRALEIDRMLKGPKPLEKPYLPAEMSDETYKEFMDMLESQTKIGENVGRDGDRERSNEGLDGLRND